MDKLTGAFEKIQFFDKLVILNQATSDNESPVPGYLYREIAEISFSSDNNCIQLMYFLVDRLKHRSSHVKLKVLKVMQNIAENGNPTFCGELRKKAQGIQECTKHGGAPHPLHGNTPYINVRRAAETLLTLLYDVDQRKAGVEEKREVMPGLGSSSAGGGFGNVTSNEKSIGESFISGLQELVATSSTDATRKPEPGQELESPPTIFNQYKSVNVDDVCIGDGRRKPSQVHIPATSTTKSRAHIPGRAGGGWDEDSDNECDRTAMGSNGSSSQSAGSEVMVTDGAERSVTSCERELQVVSDFTDVTSNKLPSRSHVAMVMKMFQELNCDAVVDAVVEKLRTNGNPTVVMRALMLIEQFLRTDVVSIPHIVQSTEGSIRNLLGSDVHPVRSKSKKILLIFEALKH